MINPTEAWSWAVAAGTKASQVVTGASFVGGLYLALGGPVPATREYVDGAVKPLIVETLSTRRSVLQLNGYFLSSEEAGMRKAVESMPDGSTMRAALERRLRDVEALRADVKPDDEKARAKLEDLASKP